VTGVVAFSIAAFTLQRDMRRGLLTAPDDEELGSSHDGGADVDDSGKHARSFAVIVPIILISIASLTPETAIRGGDATALLGGTATILLVLSCFAHQGHEALDGIAEHAREGFFFAIKIFAPIIPIAGFFFLGNPDHAQHVMGEGTPGFLFDIGNFIGEHLDGNLFLLSFGIMGVGILAGMDGSGFSGLPLVGSLASALAIAMQVDPVVLAALGQVITIFTGGGTLVAWAFGACADAGIAGVSPAELVRRNFVPVLSGMIVVTLLATVLMQK
jgi:hypothetical protein